MVTLAQVMSFDNEQDLLKRWTSLILETDPDVITGVTRVTNVCVCVTSVCPL
jgi:DNA polymerase elongation subunit (family B)